MASQTPPRPTRTTSQAQASPSDQRVQKSLQHYKELLESQKSLAAELQALLKGQGGKIGIIDNSERRVHSFNAAIAEAKKPGYFSYYKSPKHIIEQEHAGELQARIEAVTSMERELEAARQELEAARAAARQAKLDHAKAPEKAGSSLSAWFETYGRPAKDANSGYRTTFKDSTKLHGGTKHYAAFKSGATTMQVGRMMK